MEGIWVVFLVVLAVNLVPVFAPPTWLVLSFFSYKFPDNDIAMLALVGATAATIGRVVLAKSARGLVRGKLFGEETRQNLDVIKEKLHGKQTLTAGVCLFYAFSPLPSNYLFIAYGLTTLELRVLALPFFLGRLIGYNFWAHLGSAAAHKLAIEAPQSYMSVYFVLVQIACLALIYVFMRIDWRRLLQERKLRWAGKRSSQYLVPSSQSASCDTRQKAGTGSARG
ncbi:MAG TPA: hypothetical protein VJ756_01365 [Terriglobales bacterium]|jgi:hypothetical protein|nr:hypothetical protein [Terriglobales bacterium]